jgi:hypothetical protein
VEYLGLIIGHNAVSMDKGKLTGVLDWPAPKKVKEIQAFLGFANFYRRFIKDFSKIMQPITTLLRKGQTWDWGTEQDKVFQELKEAFTQAPVLGMPDPDLPFIIECDASDFATGAVLSQ